MRAGMLSAIERKSQWRARPASSAARMRSSISVFMPHHLTTCPVASASTSSCWFMRRWNSCGRGPVVMGNTESTVAHASFQIPSYSHSSIGHRAR
jgi:hypothetical protein